MKIQDLWIGDAVMLKRSGQQGTYEGIDDSGKLIVKIEGKVFFSTIDNLELSPEKIESKEIFFDENHVSNDISIKDAIDLHIEIIAPHMKNELPSRIVSFQMEKCKKYIEKAIDSKMKIVTIIHGKGEGVLRSEVHHLLSLYDEVKFVIPKHNSGATEVWFDFYS